MNNIWILAEAGNGVENTKGTELGSTDAVETESSEDVTTPVTTEDGSPPADGETPPPPASDLMKFAPLIVLFIIMYFMLMRGPKKKQEKHTKMVKSIQKNDRIQTIGGIIGTVIEIKENEIVIKIDESNNTKMRITKGAVSTVLSDDRN